MVIAARCLEATFNFKGEEEVERIEGVQLSKYLGRLLYWSDNICSEVLHNTRKDFRVWGRLGKFLQKEGVEQAISAKFYRVVIQMVLLFGE